MATYYKIKEDQQQLMPGSALVELFRIDATQIGGSIYYFTTGTNNAGGKVTFNAIDYNPAPIQFEGLEQNDEGKFPRPKVRLSNVTPILLAEVIAYQDLVGAKIVRTRTFEKYLDGKPEADPNAKFLDDVFFVERKTKQTKTVIEWELRSALDLENILIPKRQAIATCTHRYLGVNNEDSTCPYTGINGYWTKTGQATDEDGDECGKQLCDCRLRYTIDEGLPYRGFPGIGNFGIPFR